MGKSSQNRFFVFYCMKCFIRSTILIKYSILLLPLPQCEQRDIATQHFMQQPNSNMVDEQGRRTVSKISVRFQSPRSVFQKFTTSAELDLKYGIN